MPSKFGTAVAGVAPGQHVDLTRSGPLFALLERLLPRDRVGSSEPPHDEADRLVNDACQQDEHNITSSTTVRL